MPTIFYATPVQGYDDTGAPIANPDVAPNTVLLTGSALPANAAVTIAASATIGGASATETYSAAADADGNLSYVVAPASRVLQQALEALGAGGGWNDSARRWIVVSQDASGDSGSLVIELA